MVNKSIAGGIIGVWVENVQVPVRGNVSINEGLELRESVVGADGYHGITTKAQAASVEFEYSDLPLPELDELPKMTNVRVLVRYRNGRNATFNRMNAVGESLRETEEGKRSIRFEGPPGNVFYS
jgi:hypothetical protein